MRENIEFGIGSGIDPDMEEEERIKLVEEAAELAQLLHVVKQMPNGLNTMIGDRSEENLSQLTKGRGFRLNEKVTSSFDAFNREEGLGQP